MREKQVHEKSLSLTLKFNVNSMGKDFLTSCTVTILHHYYSDINEKAECSIVPTNKPFYRHGGHIELIRFKEYYRLPRGHGRISFVFSSAFRDIFS